MRYHYVPIRMAKIKIVTIPNAAENTEKLDHWHITGGNIKWYRHSRIHFGSVPVKLTMYLPHDPVIELFNIYLREMKTC